MTLKHNTDILLAAINAKWIHPSLALRLLRANLGPLKNRSGIIEFALRQKLSEKIEPILSARPKILGLSVSIWNHKATLELLKELRAGLSKPNEGRPVWKPVVVLGGPEVSFLPESAAIFGYADYVIRGEGETAFRELCEKILFEKDNYFCTDPVASSGSGCRGNGGAVFINRPETEADLREIKSAYTLYTDEDISRKLIYVESSRGCPFGCEFCVSSFSGQRPREFPLEPFFDEMDGLIKRGVKIFKFLDRSFNLNIKRAVKITEFFLERILEAPSPFCVHFEMIPRNFPEELRDLVRRFPPGSLRIEIGLQTLNAACAELIHRSGSGGEALEIVSFIAGETNAILHADLIAGLPGEDAVSFGKGFDKLFAAARKKTRVVRQPRTVGSTGFEQLPLENAISSDFKSAPEGREIAGLERQPTGLSNKSSFSTNQAAVEIQLGILKLLPGAPIARHSEKYGMRYDAEAPYEVTETAAIPKKTMDRIKNFARFWELIVNRGNYPSFVEECFSPESRAEKSVFVSFMKLSDELLERFGRSWGIDKKEMEAALDELKDKYKSSGRD